MKNKILILLLFIATTINSQSLPRRFAYNTYRNIQLGFTKEQIKRNIAESGDLSIILSERSWSIDGQEMGNYIRCQRDNGPKNTEEYYLINDILVYISIYIEGLPEQTDLYQQFIREYINIYGQPTGPYNGSYYNFPQIASLDGTIWQDGKYLLRILPWIPREYRFFIDFFDMKYSNLFLSFHRENVRINDP